MLGHYLAGLIEGDGSIIVPKTLRNEKGKLLYSVVKITFVYKDLPLAKKIQEVLGSGTIEHPHNTKYVNFLVQDVDTLHKIAVLLNGHMRTPKIEALHRLIDWLNARTSSPLQANKKTMLRCLIPKIEKLGLDESSLGDNPWLSGFLEADGNFYGSYGLNSGGVAITIKHYMRISQKVAYGKNTKEPTEISTNFHIMEKIRDFLDVKIVTVVERSRKNFVEKAFEVRTAKKTSSENLINYLSAYPLFSSKHQDYLAWCEIHDLRISKKYKTIEGTSKLISLKNSMNTMRTQFNWDSLNKFYVQ